MAQYFPPKREFNSLSVKDLLDAREAYHVHLAHLDNVLATAVGRYRIRDEDPDSKATGRTVDRLKFSPPRTLQNSSVKKWSWPCILVFVDKWLTPKQLIKQDPDQIVPRFLYLADGRVVPTCVIEAEKQIESPPPLQAVAFPEKMLGGGFPVFTDVQGQQYVASIGCLATSGDTVYALTNRHVTGIDSRDVFSYLGGEKVRIGKTALNKIDQIRNLGKKHFSEIYPGWPGSRSLANIDAGLIRIDDINNWTAQVFGIGEMDEPADLNISTISLDLIGCPVKAFGGVSGELHGEVQALFYRYRSIGGIEYISDLLIGSRNEGDQITTRPGDSGTMWFFDPKESKKGKRNRRLKPIALQWGGHSILNRGEGKQLQFALATCLSTICRELDVEVIRNWNIGHSEYWGKTGHYKIAAKACELIDDSNPLLKGLSSLLKNNIESIGFTDTAILAGDLKTIDPFKFVAMADVPDLVWRKSRRLDSSNHFANMDQVPNQGMFEGKSLMDLSVEDESTVNLATWNQFYIDLNVKRQHRGALPFRIGQIFNWMVEFVASGKIPEFVCAGGIVSHYVGDACQPLHVSHLHHGRSPEEERVHEVYETKMLDRFSTQVIAEVNAVIGNHKSGPNVGNSGEAAMAVVKLMHQTITKLPPIDIINAYNRERGRRRLEHMWEALHKRTAANIAAGSLCMATLWASAWELGGGSKIEKTELGPVDQAVLMNLYNTKTFLEAYRIDDKRFEKDLARDPLTRLV